MDLKYQAIFSILLTIFGISIITVHAYERCLSYWGECKKTCGEKEEKVNIECEEEEDWICCVEKPREFPRIWANTLHIQ